MTKMYIYSKEVKSSAGQNENKTLILTSFLMIFNLKWQWICTFSWGLDQIENIFSYNSYPETKVTISKINIFVHNFFPYCIIFCLPALNLNKRLNASFLKIPVTNLYYLLLQNDCFFAKEFHVLANLGPEMFPKWPFMSHTFSVFFLQNCKNRKWQKLCFIL